MLFCLCCNSPWNLHRYWPLGARVLSLICCRLTLAFHRLGRGRRWSLLLVRWFFKAFPFLPVIKLIKLMKLQEMKMNELTCAST